MNSRSGRFLLASASIVAAVGLIEIGAAFSTASWPSPWLIGLVLTAVGVVLFALFIAVRRFERVIVSVDLSEPAQHMMEDQAEAVDQRFDLMLDAMNSGFREMNSNLKTLSAAVAFRQAGGATLPTGQQRPGPRGGGNSSA